MNVTGILKVVEKLKLPKDEYYITGSTALYIYGIIFRSSEIKISVSKELFFKLKENEEVVSQDRIYILRSNPNIRIYVHEISKETVEISGCMVEDIKEIYSSLKCKNNKQDQAVIKKIEEAINKYSCI